MQWQESVSEKFRQDNAPGRSCWTLELCLITAHNSPSVTTAAALTVLMVMSGMTSSPQPSTTFDKHTSLTATVKVQLG